jgi:hypothetical protein
LGDSGPEVNKNEKKNRSTSHWLRQVEGQYFEVEIDKNMRGKKDLHMGHDKTKDV